MFPIHNTCWEIEYNYDGTHLDERSQIKYLNQKPPPQPVEDNNHVILNQLSGIRRITVNPSPSLLHIISPFIFSIRVFDM